MHNPVRVLQIGLAITQILAEREGYELVGAAGLGTGG